jgi:hypothetical protein
MATGREPDMIDHVNGCRDDNRVENLRAASHSDNMRNSRRPANNTSGFAGVSYKRQTNRWVAYILVGKTRKHLGYFSSKEEAHAARVAANIKYKFHPNHGSAERSLYRRTVQ